MTAHGPRAAAWKCLANGQLGEARQLFNQVLRVQPNDAHALHGLGLVAFQSGRPDIAVQAFSRSTALESKNPDYFTDLGVAWIAQGNQNEATAALEQALALRPSHGMARLTMGRILIESNDPEGAIVHLRVAAKKRPKDPDVHQFLGVAQRNCGRLGKALVHFKKAAKLAPRDPQIGSNLAHALAEAGRTKDSLETYDRVLRSNPEFPEALFGRATLFSSMGRLSDAVSGYRDLLKISPQRSDAHFNLAGSLHEMGDHEGAVESYRNTLELVADEAKVHYSLGRSLATIGRMVEARAAYRQALALDPTFVEAYRNLIDISEADEISDTVSTMEALLPGANRASAMELHFALAMAAEGTGNADRAFEHMVAGNQIKRADLNYDPARDEARFSRMISIFGADFLRRSENSGLASEAPIFIVGMPRSGTTLVEQILASHSEVHAAGEVDTLQLAINDVSEDESRLEQMAIDDWRRLGEIYLAHTPAQLAPRVTNKMSENFFFVGAIHLAFPRARIVHCRRDPVDTCLSCFMTLFNYAQEFSYDLQELGQFCRQYLDLMNHWRRVLPGRFLDLDYEALVADQRGETERLLDYCGLPWEDKCLDFYKVDRPVRTASAFQVRQPLYETAVRRWKRYESHLGPLIEVLGPGVID